jgi:ATP-dependent DNA ligase
MEARSADKIPVGVQWQYEPKWDGFRCLFGRKGARVTMRSKSGEDLTHYFPEVVKASARLAGQRFLLDGELVIPIKNRFSFDALLQRIHPAASRVEKLSKETPALFLAFDLLRLGKKELVSHDLPDRRLALERFAARHFRHTLFHVSPASRSLQDARKWLKLSGQGVDGVIAKRLDLPYQAGTREGMQKIKCYRSADCVVGGFRYGERTVAGRKVVGSLLLGLYDAQGMLHHVGFTSALTAQEKPELTGHLETIVTDHSFTGSAPGGPSRWSTKRSSEWVPLKPTLVVEISYDHFTDGRFRHGTKILRWRPDKKPTQCTMVQLRQKSVSVDALLGSSSTKGAAAASK